MAWQALKAVVGWENGENEKPRAIRLIFSIKLLEYATDHLTSIFPTFSGPDIPA